MSKNKLQMVQKPHTMQERYERVLKICIPRSGHQNNSETSHPGTQTTNTLEISFLGLLAHKWLRDFSHWKQYLNNQKLHSLGLIYLKGTEKSHLEIDPKQPRDLMSWDTKGSQRPYPLDTHVCTHTHTVRVIKLSVTSAQIVKISPNSDFLKNQRAEKPPHILQTV